MLTPTRHTRRGAVIFDVLYGFIPITPWEEQIINSRYFQRLRWIKQLGFANYIFPGAEHNRFAHAIGVMHSMHQIVTALGLNVPDHELFDRRTRSEQAMLHKCLRVSALLHDIGTFPFSHAIEFAYMRHGNDHRRTHKHEKDLPNTHEHLGSFIIKNTRHEGGITKILEDAGLDVALISKIIKGDSQYLIANQLMHSDLDADRMDYLMRDAHYTGIKYGQFDREYILANLVTFEASRGNIAFGIRENAMHAVEDFLISRFSWYSQVIKNRGSAKFDIMSSHIAKAYLEKDLLYQFHDLLTMIDERNERFFWWNDLYFMNRMQEVRFGNLVKDPAISELTEMLMYRRAPKTVHHPLFEHVILSTDNEKERERRAAKVKQLAKEMQNILKKHGTSKEWLLVDVPEKDVVFTAGIKKLMKRRSGENLCAERDPIKVVCKDGTPSLLIERDNSLMKHLSSYTNFIPSVYANGAAMDLLKAKKMIE